MRAVALLIVGELCSVSLGRGSVGPSVFSVQGCGPSRLKGCGVWWVVEELLEACSQISPVGCGVTCIGSNVPLIRIGKQLLFVITTVG
jgi:hypothetical protein